MITIFLVYAYWEAFCKKRDYRRIRHTRYPGTHWACQDRRRIMQVRLFLFKSREKDCQTLDS